MINELPEITKECGADLLKLLASRFLVDFVARLFATLRKLIGGHYFPSLPFLLFCWDGLYDV